MPKRFAARSLPPSPKRRCARRGWTRPRLETLEDRTLPATFDLVGGAAMFFASPASSSRITLSWVGTGLVLRDDAETISLGAGAQAAGFTGDGGHQISCPVAGFTALELVGGNGSDQFTILGTGAAPTTLVTGTGSNLVDVEGTTGALYIAGTGGADTITVGNPGAGGSTLSTIAGAVSVTNVTPTTDLVVDDGGDPLGTQATLVSDGTVGQISSDIQTPLDVLLGDPVLARFVPAPIGFDCAAIHSLTVRGGGGGNRFVVAGTGPFQTELDSGTGLDNVSVLATFGPLLIEGQDGRDAVRVGQGPLLLEGTPIPGSPLLAIQGAVVVANDHSRTDLVVDDGAAPTASSLSVAGDRVGILGAAGVEFAAAQLESLTVLGAAGDAFTVDGTPAGAATEIDTGTGSPVDLLATDGLLRVVDADGTALIASTGDAFFRHLIGRGPLPLSLATTTATGSLAVPTDADVYVLQVPTGGTFSASLHGAGVFAGRLDLLSPDSFVDYTGRLIGGGGLLSSDLGRPADGVDPSLSEYLRAGTYYLIVSPAGPAGGVYSLASSLVPGSDPLNVAEDVDPALNDTVGDHPVDLIAADFNRDGITDLATVNQGSADVSVLVGIGDGTFEGQKRFFVGGSPDALATKDVNDDGRLDLVLRDSAAGNVTVLFGLGDGTFDAAKPLIVSIADPRVAGIFAPAVTLAGDFNRDGFPDLAMLAPLGTDEFRVDVSLGAPVSAQGTVATPLGLIPLATFVGSGIQLPSNSLTSSPAQATPVFADLNGDGTPDVVTVSRSGDIFYRPGLPGGSGGFDAAVLVNPGVQARAVALVSAGPVAELAAVDLYSNRVSLYRLGADGTWTGRDGPATQGDPARVVVADLDGDGIPDLVVGNKQFGLASVSIYRGAADGTFTPVRDIEVETSISDLEVADVNHDGHPDLLVTNPDSGDVEVLLNEALPSGQINFADAGRWRAGVGTYGVETSAISDLANGVFASLGLPSIFPPVFFNISNEETAGVATGDFFGTGESDLVVVNRGTDCVTLLRGQPGGGFATEQVVATGPHPIAVAAGDFDGDNQQDLAVLMQLTGEVWIFRGDGGGHFTHTSTMTVGADATGLAEIAGGPGRIDLLVVNEAGDVLRLKGDGRGGFTPPVLTGNAATLDTQSLTASGQPAVLVANQSANRVTIQEQVGAAGGFSPVAALTAGSPGTQLAPGDVKWARLEGGLFDAVVIGTGSNNLLVYHALGFDAAGNPLFAPPATYAVGTAPVGVTVQDLNADGIPDMLVANRGSNDISVLFGSLDAAGNWAATPGPRLKSDGVAPLSASVREIGGRQELVITNGESGTVTLLPGRGNGFFDDRNPQVLTLPGPVVQPPSFAGGVGVTVTAAGQVVRFDLDQFASVESVFLPGHLVTAAALLGDGSIVAATAGAVLHLRLDATGGFESTSLAGPAGDLLAPSALEVLQDGRVLVTSQGQDSVLVFSLGLAQPALPGLTTGTEPVASAGAFESGALVLAVTLTAPSLTSTDQEESQPATAAAFLLNPVAPAFVPAVGPPVEEVQVVARSEGFEWSPEWMPGVDEALRRLQLYTPPDEIPGAGDPPAPPEGRDPVLGYLDRQPWRRPDEFAGWQGNLAAFSAASSSRAGEWLEEFAGWQAKPSAAMEPVAHTAEAGHGAPEARPATAEPPRGQERAVTRELWSWRALVALAAGGLGAWKGDRGGLPAGGLGRARSKPER